jgi:predicted methyltransferase
MKKIRIEELEENNCILINGFDDCILGITDTTFGEKATKVAIYDVDDIIFKLMQDNEYTIDEAEDYFAYNILSQGYTENTPHNPIFMHRTIDRYITQPTNEKKTN